MRRKGIVMPDIYHITHLGNLASIVESGSLWSDAERIRRGFEHQNVGLTEIKASRLHEREVHCHPGTMVGQYVPFHFCPRSIMLYLLHRGNRQGLTYVGGQQPIVHLVANVERTVAWADVHGVRWAFSNRNAGTVYAEFFADLAQLGRINWSAVQATDFRDAQIKDGKQAEFLLFGRFPWELVERIGVMEADIASQVHAVLGANVQNPVVEVMREWYY
jgi:hypothetical protein